MKTELKKVFDEEKENLFLKQKENLDKEINLLKAESATLFANSNRNLRNTHPNMNKAQKVDSYVNEINWWYHSFMNYKDGKGKIGERN